MRRINTFTVLPRSPEDEELLRQLLDASASLWNELTYERRQQFFDGESVWDTADYRKQYVGVLGSATAQQVIRKNSEAWWSFFAAREDGEDTAPPGYWGSEDDGRELRTYIRNDQYTVRWGSKDRSTIEITVGNDLKDEYDMGYRERLTLNVRGRPKWSGDQGRLELYYDELSDRFRAFQPVTVDDSRQDSPLADETAALDIGANNIVACTTTTGQQYLYEGRDLFERFRNTTGEIARLQSLLEDGRYTSKRIRRLYRRRTRRRDHAMDALARNLFERLYEEGISTVYVGDLTDVLETALVGAGERQDAQLLGVPGVHRPARVYRRGVRYHRRSPPRSVDLPRVSELRFDRGHHAPPRHAHVYLRLRGARGPHGIGDVPPTSSELGEF